MVYFMLAAVHSSAATSVKTDRQTDRQIDGVPPAALMESEMWEIRTRCLKDGGKI